MKTWLILGEMSQGGLVHVVITIDDLWAEQVAEEMKNNGFAVEVREAEGMNPQQVIHSLQKAFASHRPS